MVDSASNAAAGHENWVRSYREAPEIFDAFSRAEDPERVIVRRLLAHAGLGGRSVLEIGCGTGRYTGELAAKAENYLAIDRSPRMLALARERCLDSNVRLLLLRADAERLPIASSSVERVLATWVLAEQRPATRSRILAEISRVLSPGTDSALWLVENHWSGEFQELRGARRELEGGRLRGLIESSGFEPVEIVRTELRFRSADQAERVLGYLCGESVRQALRCRPTAVLGHNVLILRRPAAG